MKQEGSKFTRTEEGDYIFSFAVRKSELFEYPMEFERYYIKVDGSLSEEEAYRAASNAAYEYRRYQEANIDRLDKEALLERLKDET